jgi:hypothetical protein
LLLSPVAPSRRRRAWPWLQMAVPTHHPQGSFYCRGITEGGGSARAGGVPSRPGRRGADGQRPSSSIGPAPRRKATSTVNHRALSITNRRKDSAKPQPEAGGTASLPWIGSLSPSPNVAPLTSST